MYPTVVAMCSDWDQPKIIGTFDNKAEAQAAVEKINQTTHIQAYVVEPTHNPKIGRMVRIFMCRIISGRFETPHYSNYTTIPHLEQGPEPPEVEETGTGCWTLWAFNQHLLNVNLNKLKQRELAK